MTQKKVSIHIDTTEREKTVIRLNHSGKTYTSSVSRSHYTAQSVLPEILGLLRSHALTWQDVTHVEVSPGPGSYTGLRVGVAIANTIGWVLKIPVNGKKKNVVLPRYNS